MDVDWDQVPPSAERGPPGKVRPLWRGVLLTVVTLGLYHFWWHLRSHQELTLFVGRPDRLHYLGLAYVVSFLVGVVFVLFIVVPAGVDYEQEHGEPPFSQRGDDPIEQPTPTSGDSDPSPTFNSNFESLQFLDFLHRVGLLGPFLVLLTLHSLIFGTFVLLQHRTLYQHISPSHTWGTDASSFLGVFWGAHLIAQLIPIAVLLQTFSYHRLQRTYNRFWSGIQQEPSPLPLLIGDETANAAEDAQSL